MYGKILGIIGIILLVIACLFLHFSISSFDEIVAAGQFKLLFIYFTGELFLLVLSGSTLSASFVIMHLEEKNKEDKKDKKE